MLQYGQHVSGLLQELKRTDGRGQTTVACSLPPYNDVLVQQARHEYQMHSQQLQDQVKTAKEVESRSGKTPKELRPSMVVENAACQRTQRGLLIYHRERLHRLQELIHWNADTVQSKNMSPAEQLFFEQYQQLVARYTERVVPDVIDLRSHASVPPLAADRVLCRVMLDFGGPIVLESGVTADWKQGSTHFVLYTDCEEYLRTGALRLLDTEEQEG